LSPRILIKTLPSYARTHTAAREHIAAERAAAAKLAADTAREVEEMILGQLRVPASKI
jgi:hypothetical protein